MFYLKGRYDVAKLTACLIVHLHFYQLVAGARVFTYVSIEGQGVYITDEKEKKRINVLRLVDM